jgi:hypothetical protein
LTGPQTGWQAAGQRKIGEWAWKSVGKDSGRWQQQRGAECGWGRTGGRQAQARARRPSTASDGRHGGGCATALLSGAVLHAAHHTGRSSLPLAPRHLLSSEGPSCGPVATAAPPLPRSPARGALTPADARARGDEQRYCNQHEQASVSTSERRKGLVSVGVWVWQVRCLHQRLWRQRIPAAAGRLQRGAGALIRRPLRRRQRLYGVCGATIWLCRTGRGRQQRCSEGCGQEQLQQRGARPRGWRSGGARPHRGIRLRSGASN